MSSRERGENTLKDPRMYETLREEGASEEKAARISNAASKGGRSSVGRKGGESRSYEDWTVPDLKTRARELGMSGYSKLRKEELVSKLRNH